MAKRAKVDWALLDQQIRKAEKRKMPSPRGSECKITYKDGSLSVQGMMFLRVDYDPARNRFFQVLDGKGLRLGNALVIPDPRVGMRLKKGKKFLRCLSTCTISSRQEKDPRLPRKDK